MTASRNAVCLVTLTLEARPALRNMKDGRVCAYVQGREGDGDESRLWQLFALSEKGRRELRRCRESDVLSVRGRIDVTAANGVVALRMNVEWINPLKSWPRKAKWPGTPHRGTHQIDPEKVAAANAEWARKQAQRAATGGAGDAD